MIKKVFVLNLFTQVFFLHFSASGSFMVVWVAVIFCFFPFVAGHGVLFTLLQTPMRYFCPIRTCESCLALTRNASYASFMVPLLKYFWHIFNETVAARMQVGPFLGDLTIPGASSLGRTMLSIFCSVISAAVFALGSFIGLKYWAGTFTCTGDRIAAFRTMSKVSLSAILPSDEMFAYAVLMLTCASLR